MSSISGLLAKYLDSFIMIFANNPITVPRDLSFGTTKQETQSPVLRSQYFTCPS